MTKLKITDWNGFGDGVARDNGKVYFTPKTLVGDVIEAISIQESKRFNKVLQYKLISPSNLRKEPDCLHYTECGACKIQGLEPGDYRKWKQKVVQNSIRGCLSELPEPEFVWSETDSFRSRTLFHIHPDNQKLCRVDWHGDLLPVSQCTILAPSLQERIKPLNNVLKDLSSGLKGELFRVFLQWNPEPKEVVTGIILNKIFSHSKEQFEEAFQDYSLPLFIASRQREEWNPKTLVWINPSAHTDPGFFTQTNPQINEIIQSQIKIWVEKHTMKRVVDLFCGSGSHLQKIQSSLQKGIGIESNQAAISRALQINSSEKLDFICSKLPSTPIKYHEILQSLDSFIVNPPRAGIGESFLNSSFWKTWFENANCGIYMSCNLVSLQRDLNLLRSRFDFEVIDWKLFDMFPWTSHAEALVLLSKDKSNPAKLDSKS